ncbi:putative phosphoribosyltransferase [Mycolicibacterium chubuense NBB4]|uniref:Putative phosphoribosyltransferase n=1 Tax=Mycolicibacterium chubuense (strain NBB4) TaxID=710421 RepID=I4BEV8_MYCCN|nr:alpha/beta family hydrolase [Mycolicibacterium chubuense]AFM15815.1 putative phosphoribosyltransferase [Mycolicibacterium chubuense NBB4]
MQLFHDRAEAGRRLAERLERFRDSDVVVLGLPRGGVPVAFEVARSLRAPLDVLVVRRLAPSFEPEVAYGAIAEDDVRIVNDAELEQMALGEATAAEIEAVQRAELAREVALYRRGRERIPLAGRVALIVDYGLTSEASARAACEAARAQGATRIVLAAPVGSRHVVDAMNYCADDVVYLETPKFYFYAAVGQGYHRFRQTSDDEVVALLDAARDGIAPASAADAPAADPRDEEVRVTAGAVEVAGRLTIPENPEGIVVFAHGSGSSRHSPRNRYVADVLNEAGLATLLFDLLTPAEEGNRANVFDIELLARRLVDVTAWLSTRPDTASLPIGYFGASTGAGAALTAAADTRVEVGAVVSRGGRPDLAGRHLYDVYAPTLLIVGGRDEVVLELNRRAQAAIPGQCNLTIVPGATHLFEEPGTLEAVAALARDWFLNHLSRTPADV